MNTNPKNIPADGIAGLKQNFLADLQAGFMVFLLALPLSLGIAKASGFPNPIFGVVTAIVGGIIVSFFAGSRLTIKGPAAGLIVIVAGSVEAFGGGESGWHLALGCIVTAAIIQIMFGLLKLGNLADFFPGAAIHGMLAAIGLIIIIKQIPILLGVAPALLKHPSEADPTKMVSYETLPLAGQIPNFISAANAHIAIIGLICLAIMFIFMLVKHPVVKKIPGPLVVLLVAIPLAIFFHLGTDEVLGKYSLVKVGHITDILSKQFINVDFSGMGSHTGVFIQYVILYALIGSLESLLTVKAIDGLDPYHRKSNANKDLTGLGIGNALSGIIGGLPMISEVVRSSANVGFGAKTRWANFFHGLFLLVALLVAVPVIEMIPNAALAALLIFAGYRLASPKEFKNMLHVGVDQFVIFIITIFMTLATDLLIGVGSGIALELLLNLFSGAKISNFFKSRSEVITSGEEVTVKVTGDALFSNYLGLKKVIYALPKAKKVTIDLTGCHVIDHTTLHSLHGFQHDYEMEGGKVVLKEHASHTPKGKAPTSTRTLKIA
ncbi:MAG: SulP family inorganic anion transporter [Bacteroidetes bacterium]|nr:SulP family inorganic anion transporter [Bacteroidota bacterium]